MFKNPFSFQGRINRLEFLLSFLAVCVLIVIAVMIDYTTKTHNAFGITLIPTIWLMIAQMLKRLHDLNQSGWLLILIAIPVINVGLTIYLLLWQGTPGRNQYGYEPGSKEIITNAEPVKADKETPGHLSYSVPQKEFEEQTSINKENQKENNNTLMNLIGNFLKKNSLYVIYSLFSLLAGIFSGGYFRTPSNKLLKYVYNAESEWQKEIIIERARKAYPFLFSDTFEFNWLAFMITTLACIFLILFFFDKSFRRFLYNKISFSEERKSSRSIP